MCGRYALYHISNLEDLFQTRPATFALRDSYNVAPGQVQPIIAEHEQQRDIIAMKWGLVPAWAKDPRLGYKLINARSEGLFDKSAWREPAQHQRCLIPASGFYEWRPATTTRPKRPFFIRPTDQAQFAFAGIYSRWRSGKDDELVTYAMATTKANRDMAAIHDRMPVILHPSDWSIWLNPTLADREILTQLLRPYDGELTMYPVSSDVNSVQHNSDYLVQPLETMDA